MTYDFCADKQTLTKIYSKLLKIDINFKIKKMSQNIVSKWIWNPFKYLKWLRFIQIYKFIFVKWNKYINKKINMMLIWNWYFTTEKKWYFTIEI